MRTDVKEKLAEIVKKAAYSSLPSNTEDFHLNMFVMNLLAHGVTVQEWINSEEMLPEFPCLALYVNGNSVFIPDGVLTIKDEHGEWCIDSSLAKEVRLIDGTKIDALIWENRIAYWMPIPQPPKGE